MKTKTTRRQPGQKYLFRSKRQSLRQWAKDLGVSDHHLHYHVRRHDQFCSGEASVRAALEFVAADVPPRKDEGE